jgi:hypothetical protein
MTPFTRKLAAVRLEIEEAKEREACPAINASWIVQPGEIVRIEESSSANRINHTRLIEPGIREDVSPRRPSLGNSVWPIPCEVIQEKASKLRKAKSRLYFVHALRNTQKVRAAQREISDIYDICDSYLMKYLTLSRKLKKFSWSMRFWMVRLVKWSAKDLAWEFPNFRPTEKMAYFWEGGLWLRRLRKIIVCQISCSFRLCVLVNSHLLLLHPREWILQLILYLCSILSMW